MRRDYMVPNDNLRLSFVGVGVNSGEFSNIRKVVEYEKHHSGDGRVVEFSKERRIPSPSGDRWS